MAMIFTTNKSYADDNAYKDVIGYASNMSKTVGYIGGSSAELYETASAIRHMQAVYNTYKSMYEESVSRLCHFIISFKPTVTVDNASEIISFLKHLCTIVGIEHQCFWGLHLINPNPNSDDVTHVHFIVNRISYVNGKYLSNNHIREIKQTMHQLLEQYGIEE